MNIYMNMCPPNYRVYYATVSSNRRKIFFLLYCRTQFMTQFSNINFRSTLLKPWLYFNGSRIIQTKRLLLHHFSVFL